MDLQIIKANESFSLEEHGIQADDIIISSLPLNALYSSPDGSDRSIDYGVTFGKRTITVPIRFESRDLLDFPLFRDLIFSLVLDKNSFYIRERRRADLQPYAFQTPEQEEIIPESYHNRYIGGKRYKVRLQNEFNLEQFYRVGKGELVFETTELPFAESIGTTQDIQRDGISADSALWGFGMGLLMEEEAQTYTHTIAAGETVRIWNAGNVAIHPFEHELNITLDQVSGSTSSLTLKNNTNGTTFQVTEAVSDTQTIVLDGPNITSDGLHYLRNTNKQYIELEPGWNDFTVDGVSSVRVAFNFRFYYV